MKYVVLFAAVLLAGCNRPSQVQAKVDAPVAAKAPCAPDVNGEMKVVRPTITEVTPENSSWDETHKVSCPNTMRTVLPSVREVGDAISQPGAFEKLEYCIPDGKH